jgi:simple sugar transport system permease protein
VRLRRVLLSLAAPVAALVFSIALSALLLQLSGHDPVDALSAMWDFGNETRTRISIINGAVPLYLSGLAVAVGFKMGLFNIGVEGQYGLAALLAAATAAAVDLPAPIHVALVVVVAMAVGGAWAGIAGVLKVTRNVHEVISTIMLNFIATGVGAYLLANYFKEEAAAGSLNVKTKEIPPSGRFPSLNSLLDAIGIDVPRGANLQGFVLVAILAGIGYHVLVNRLRFGFDLRASGINPWAAQTSGVAPKAMVVRTMVLSGAIAGLVGLSALLGFFHQYTLDFPTGLGFAGIAAALLGRNHPVGIAIGALIFSYLDRSAQILDLEDIPKEIVTIMQGIIIISVVVAYEVVRRLVLAQEAQTAAAAEPQQRAEVAA